VLIDRTYQLNFGGNWDCKNMIERERLTSKKISKNHSVGRPYNAPPAANDIDIGPSDFAPWLTDRKWAHIRIDEIIFNGAPLNTKLKLEVWDTPNSASVVINAVGCAPSWLWTGGPALRYLGPQAIS
jgi:myo-inositol-1-phosphate synthase